MGTALRNSFLETVPLPSSSHSRNRSITRTWSGAGLGLGLGPGLGLRLGLGVGLGLKVDHAHRVLAERVPYLLLVRLARALVEVETPKKDRPG